MKNTLYPNCIQTLTGRKQVFDVEPTTTVSAGVVSSVSTFRGTS